MTSNAKKVRRLSPSNIRIDNSRENDKRQTSFCNDFLCDRTVEFMESGDTRNIVAVELAEQSMYFERLVRYHKGRGVIHLPEFLKSCFDDVINYIRSGKVELTEENVYEMFVAADYLLVSSLKKKCYSFIQEMIQNPSCAVSLWVMCQQFHWPELCIMAYEEILKNFEQIWKTEEFLELDKVAIKDIIMNDQLNCKREINLVAVIAAWVRKSSETRQFFAFELLKCVRLGLLSQDELLSLKQTPIVQSTVPYVCLLDNWSPYSKEKSSFLSPQEIFRMMNPRVPHDAIFVFGGWCDGTGPKSATQVYDPKADRWTMWNLDTLATNLIGDIPRRVYAGCVIIEHKAYLVGGFDGHNALKSTLCYDFEINSGWFEISCMYENRYYVGVAHCDGKIYAMGGHNNERTDNRLDSAERYHLEENLWEPIAPMNRVRSDASAASLDGKVYIVGGFEGRRYHDSAEMYDPFENQWTFIGHMNSPRGGVSLVQHGEFIYAIGGNDGHSRLSSIERYSVEGGQWEAYGNLLQQKSNLSSTVIDDDIYIIGGWTDEQEHGILNTVEKFNITSRTCATVKPLLFAASATCSCTLSSHILIARFVNRDQHSLTKNLLPLP